MLQHLLHLCLILAGDGEAKVAQDDVLTFAPLAGRDADQIGTKGDKGQAPLTLILAPWGLDEEIMKTDANATEAPSDYARFHRLNDLAEEICNTTDVTLLNMTGIA